MKRPVATFLALLSPSIVMADLAPMSDSDLSDVEGSGLGIVLEDFSFHATTDESQADNQSIFKITGIKSSDGRDVEVKVNNFFIGGKDSASFLDNGDGTSSFVVNPTPVNIGRLNNPLEISQRDGDDVDVRAPNKGVLEIARSELPEINGDPVWTGATMDPCLKAGAAECSKFASREATADYQGERIDFGLDLNAVVDPDNAGSDDGTPLTLYVKEASFDGSYIRLWGDENATGSETDAEQRNITLANVRLNMYTPEVLIASCGINGDKCGDAVHIKHLALDLIVGVGEIQPAMLSVTSDGNFQVEVEALPNPTTPEGAARLATLRADMSDSASWMATDKEFYENYYNDTIPGVKTKSNFYIGDPTVANPTFDTAGGLQVGNTYLGTSKIEGLQIQYMKMTTHDIGG
jgi:hypothetical protein